jgi:serine/threonine-protein kinase
MWRQYLAGALSQRGHLREAYETNRRLLLDPAASPFSWFEDPFVDLSLLGIVPDSVARAAFARGLEPEASWGNALMTPRHLRGLPWWLQRRDTLSLARFAARAAEVSGRPGTLWVTLRSQLLGSMAEAYLSLARGDSTDALRRLQAIPDALCIADDYAPNCFHLRLTQARLLAARGQHRQAADLIEVWRLDKVPASPSFVLAMLERARLAEVLGEREKAIESYGFVSACWRKADPELQGFVEEAREALVRLGGR